MVPKMSGWIFFFLHKSIYLLLGVNFNPFKNCAVTKRLCARDAAFDYG